MKTLVIVNGGAEGGLVLTSHGIVAAVPFDPDLLNTLKGTAKLVIAMHMSKDKDIAAKLARMAIGTANLSVEMSENLFGQLNPDRAIVFQDADGGFTCGSTGKPPLPISWPPRPFKDANELIRAGVIEADVLELLRVSKAKNKDLTEVFEKPAATAKELGLPLSAKSAENLSLLAPSQVSKVKDPVDQEMLRLFHAVLKDGRFTQTWFERPQEVSQSLNIKVSETALERILGVTGQARLGESVQVSAIAAGVIWAGVCIAVGTLFVGQMNPIDTLITDRSGAAKF